MNAISKQHRPRMAGSIAGMPGDGGGPGSGPSTLVMGAGTLILVVGAFATMIWLTSDPERQTVVEGLVQSPTGLVILFGLAALSTATLILPAPGLALTAIAGAAGDPILVGVVAGLGQAVGELTGYAAGRSGRSLLPTTAGSARLEDWLRSRGTIVIFVLAAVPNPVFDVAGVAAGAVHLGVSRYLAAAAAGKILKNLVVAVAASTVAGAAAIGIMVLTSTQI